MVIITANELLKEAQTLGNALVECYMPDEDLTTRIKQLGDKFRNVSGITSLEPDYHRAARIYSDILEIGAWHGLRLEDVKPVTFDINRAK